MRCALLAAILVALHQVPAAALKRPAPEELQAYADNARIAAVVQGYIRALILRISTCAEKDNHNVNTYILIGVEYARDKTVVEYLDRTARMIAINARLAGAVPNKEDGLWKRMSNEIVHGLQHKSVEDPQGFQRSCRALAQEFVTRTGRFSPLTELYPKETNEIDVWFELYEAGFIK
jgi:hypothetical protein